MDGLCGTSSSWLFPVTALEPKYNKSGKLHRIKSIPARIFRFGGRTLNMSGTLVIAAVCYGEETFLPQQPWNIGSCTDGTGVSDPFSFESELPLRLLFAVGDITLADIPNRVPMLKPLVVSTHSPRVVRSFQGIAAKLLRHGRCGVLSCQWTVR
jgi:hypothetical protein